MTRLIRRCKELNIAKELQGNNEIKSAVSAISRFLAIVIIRAAI